ncbi:unnamed protein product [Rangifer tarandus platyrhynchus]|uniref:Uncharacterized protein n=1 Tax=Rangifer tarandus platyrhynchus TaxID=3082113 RepID=A0ABN8XX76_RANTA|nr:unnamed protein product [Rangifer tarandus platyrhynchus]
MVPPGGRAPTRPPASPPPRVHPTLPPTSGGRGRDLGAHTSRPLGSDYTRFSGPYPRTWLADGPLEALGSPRVTSLGFCRIAPPCSSSCLNPPRNPRGDSTPNVQGLRAQKGPGHVRSRRPSAPKR